MKKIYSFLMIMIMTVGAMTMTSCDDDQIVGMKIEGVWEGQMWNDCGSSNITRFQFIGDTFRFTKGTGYWVDYYSHLDYYADRIRWEVRDGAIYIHSFNDRIVYTIFDYHISDYYFEGWISDDYGNESKFRLRKIADTTDWEHEYSGWNDYGWQYNWIYKKSKTTSWDQLEKEKVSLAADSLNMKQTTEAQLKQLND